MDSFLFVIIFCFVFQVLKRFDLIHTNISVKSYRIFCFVCALAMLSWLDKSKIMSFHQFLIHYVTASLIAQLGLPHSSDGKESACNAGGPCSIPGRSAGGGIGHPVQYSGEFRGLYSPWGHKESRWLSNFQLTSRYSLRFPGGTSGKESVCQWRRHGDVGSTPGLGMAAHCSSPAWASVDRGLGGLQSWGRKEPETAEHHPASTAVPA